VKDKGPSDATVFRWMRGVEEPEPLMADATEEQTGTDMKGRTQRQTMALKNVRYRLHGEIIPWPDAASEIKSFDDQFRRRAAQGKCFYQPCFGCREFPAFFRLVEKEEPFVEPLPMNQDIGWMLFDVFDLSRPGTCDARPYITLFKAQVQNGVLLVPKFSDPTVVKPLREGASC